MMNQGAFPESQFDIHLALPILPGKSEAWRRFIQELQGPRQSEWKAWCGRVGLKRVQVWLSASPQQTIVLLQATFAQTDCYSHPTITDKLPFDRWLREHILALHGIDIALLWLNCTSVWVFS